MYGVCVVFLYEICYGDGVLMLFDDLVVIYDVFDDEEFVFLW